MLGRLYTISKVFNITTRLDFDVILQHPIQELGDMDLGGGTFHVNTTPEPPISTPDVRASGADPLDIYRTTFETKEFTVGAEDGAVVFKENVVRIQGIPILEYRITGNPVSVADTYSFTINLQYLPIPLDWISEIRVQFWHVEGTVPIAELSQNSVGYYAGLVDTIERDRRAGTVRVACRDMTAILIDAKVPKEFLSTLDEHSSLIHLILTLLKTVPGTEKWNVVLSSFESIDSKRVNKFAQGSFYDAISETGFDIHLLKGNNDASAAKEVLAKTMKSQSDLSRVNIEDFVFNSIDVHATDTVSVWDIMVKLCTLVTMVPTVQYVAGNFTIQIVPVSEIHEGIAFNTFIYTEDADAVFRIMNMGEDIETLREKRKITSATVPDILTLFSVDGDSGSVITASYGLSKNATSKNKNQKTDTTKRIAQIVPGKMPQGALDDLAKLIWFSMRKGELEISVSTKKPWTAGGSKTDMDLLHCRAGQSIVIGMPNMNAWTKGVSPYQQMRAIGLPDTVAQIFSRYADTYGSNTIFQVHTIRQGISRNGEYTCDLQLQGFLDLSNSDLILSDYVDIEED